jgi:hydroxypyruvate isomerase
MTRRTFVGTASAVAAVPALGQGQKMTRKGRLKQCVTRGCFAKSGLDVAGMSREAASRGVVGFDLISPPDFATLKEHGLIPTMVPGGSTIPDGINRKELHDGIEKRMREAIEATKAAGAPNVIVLAGNRRGMGDEEGIANAVAYFNRIKAMAEDKQITLCLEYLNSKVNHKDYHFDKMWWGVEVCKRVNSPRVKILLDMYHVQIMEGDIIRTLRDNFQYIALFHTAGYPGRHEMDDTQEMNYRGIARAIADLNYSGYIAHEYSPLRDPLKSLDETLTMFDV